MSKSKEAKFYRDLIMRLARESPRLMSTQFDGGFTGEELLNAMQAKAAVCDADGGWNTLDEETRERLKNVPAYEPLAEPLAALRFTCGSPSAYEAHPHGPIDFATPRDAMECVVRQAEYVAGAEHPSSMAKRSIMRDRLVRMARELEAEFKRDWIFR